MMNDNAPHPLQNSRSAGRKSDLIQEIAVETASRETAKYDKIPPQFEDCRRGERLDTKTHARPDGTRSTQDGEIGEDDAPQGGGLDRAVAAGADPVQPRGDIESARGHPSPGLGRSPDAAFGARAVAQTAAVEPAAPGPAPIESPAIAEKTEPEPPPPPPEDPTKKALASLAAATAKEVEAAASSDRRAGALEEGYRSAIAESGRWKRREMLVRQQIAGITADAEKLEREADEIDAERDVLERERDATKAALSKASTRSGFAVLPYKGPNGTWRRPIVIECTTGGAKLQPHGPSFTTLELSPRIRPKSSVFVKAVARELLHIRSAETPDGTPAVPYVVFLVRPDGIGPYYLARTCLEPLGMAFGYELVEQKLAINIPDFDDLTTWDGSVPLEVPIEPAPAPGSSSRRLARADQAADQQKTPAAGSGPGDQGSMIGALDGAGRGNRLGGEGGSSSGNPQPEDFVWPGRGRQAAQQGQRSSSVPGGGERGSQLAGGDSAAPAGDRTSTRSKPTGGAGALGPMAGRELAKADATGSGGERRNTDKSGAAAGGDSGTSAGPFSVAKRGSQDTGEAPGGSGSGVSPGAPNAEDVGTGAGAGLADQPFSQGDGGTGALAAGANIPGGGIGPGPGHIAAGGNGSGSGTGISSGNGAGGSNAGTDSVFQVPTFEPAGEKAARSASLGQPGLLSGRPSGGSTGAGVQAPAFGLGQSIKGSGAGGSQGTAGAGDQGSDGATGARSNGADPAGDGSTGTKTNGMGGTGTGTGQGKGKGQGFDWEEAAKDSPPASGAEASGADPALGAAPPEIDPGPQTSADAARANVSAGGALNRPNPPATGLPPMQTGALPPGQYSQDDIARAQRLSGLGSLVSPSLAQKLAGSGSASASGSSSAISSSASSSNNTSNQESSGMPSSLPPSSTSTNNQPGGMPLGGMTQPNSSSSPSASSSFSFGQNSSPSSNSDESTDFMMPPRPKPVLPDGAIEARFQIVVVCRKDEVVLQPGSYRLTGDVLRSTRQGADGMLAREIRAMVRNRAIVDPMIRQKPAIKFLVESQGAETFALARRQLLFSLPDWPVSLQVAGSHDIDVFSRNRW